jgi:hypothetical protein
MPPYKRPRNNHQTRLPGDLACHMAALELASRTPADRLAIADALRVLATRLEEVATQQRKSRGRSTASLADGRPAPAGAHDAPVEYWSGYWAFRRGEALTGWTDTPYARGWIAAASDVAAVRHSV